MGDGGEAVCERGCGYRTPQLMWGAGMSWMSKVFACPQCGRLDSNGVRLELEAVLLKIENGEYVEEEPIQAPFCAHCRTEMTIAPQFSGSDLGGPDAEHVPGAVCPDCGGRLVWELMMLWD